MLPNEYYTQDQHGPYKFFDLGDFHLESGQILQDAKLAYAVHGQLNEAKDNAILFISMFFGTSRNMEHYIGEDKTFDPNKFCIILPNQIGGAFLHHRIIPMDHKPCQDFLISQLVMM